MLLTMSQESDATESSCDTRSDAGTTLPEISTVPKTDTESPKIISNAPLTKRYIALFKKIKETELLMVRRFELRTSSFTLIEVL